MASLQSTRSALASCSRCVSSSRTGAFNLGSLAASLPSTSYKPSASSSSSFHTSAPASETRKKRLARLKRKSNLDQRTLKQRMLEASKPDPVLGHQLNDAGHKVWEKSELAKLILDKDEVWGVKEDRRGNLVSTEVRKESKIDWASRRDANEFGGPRRLNFGLETKDRQLLFQSLPNIMVKDRILDSWNLGVMIKGKPNNADVQAFDEEYNRLVQEEQSSATLLSRVLDLRNASGKGIQVENIKRIVEHFGQKELMGKLGKGVNTGSAEVQAAVLTYRIRNLSSHLLTARHDNSNRRAMTMLVQQRAKILKYLRRKSLKRYDAILPRLGIEARAVEGEIIVPGKPKIATA